MVVLGTIECLIRRVYKYKSINAVSSFRGRFHSLIAYTDRYTAMLKKNKKARPDRENSSPVSTGRISFRLYRKNQHSPGRDGMLTCSEAKIGDGHPSE